MCYLFNVGTYLGPGGSGTLPRSVQLIEIPEPDKNKVIEKTHCILSICRSANVSHMTDWHWAAPDVDRLRLHTNVGRSSCDVGRPRL